MACKPVVPSCVGVFMFWGQGSYLGGVKTLEKFPNILNGPQEKNVCVHIKEGISLGQHMLKREEGKKSEHVLLSFHMKIIILNFPLLAIPCLYSRPWPMLFLIINTYKH